MLLLLLWSLQLLLGHLLPLLLPAETTAVRQLVTGTAARATKAVLGRTGSAAGTASAENKTNSVNKDAQRGLA